MDGVGCPIDCVGGPMDGTGGPMDGTGGPMVGAGGPMEGPAGPIQGVEGPAEDKGRGAPMGPNWPALHSSAGDSTRAGSCRAGGGKAKPWW